MRSPILPVAAGAVLLASGPCLASTVVFSDGIFSSSDWDTVVELRGIGTVGSGSATQLLTGGNPDQFRQISASRDPDAAGPDNSTRVSSIYLGQTYDPVAMGAIATIDFAIDAIQPAGQGASGGSVAPILIQGGVVYQGPSEAMPEAAWTLHDFLALTNTSFSEIGAPGSHPDFSSTGGEISFGWVYVISSASGDPVARTVGFDNWNLVVDSVSVPPVPEPGTLGLLGLGVGSLWLMRRRPAA
jgi:hypothetical protein